MNKKDEVTVRIVDTEINNSEYKKLLGIEIGTKPNFNENLNDLIQPPVIARSNPVKQAAKLMRCQE